MSNNTIMILAAVLFILVWVAWKLFWRIVNPEPIYHRIGEVWETNYNGEGRRYRQMVVNNNDPNDVEEIDVTDEVKR